MFAITMKGNYIFRHIMWLIAKFLKQLRELRTQECIAPDERTFGVSKLIVVHQIAIVRTFYTYL